MRLHRRHVAFANQAKLAQMKQLREAVGEAVLEHRAKPAAALLLDLGQRVGLGERAGERLFQHDVAAGEQRLACLLEMQRRRRADRDEVEVALDERVEIGQRRGDAVVGGDLARLRSIDVADRLDRIELGEFAVGGDMARRRCPRRPRRP